MYGVVIGKIIGHDEGSPSDPSPHYKLIVDSEEGDTFEVPINVRSRDKRHPDLLYYRDKDYNAKAITILPNLPMGFNEINYHTGKNADIAVDFIRSGLFDPKKMEVVQTGHHNDLIKFIKEYVEDKAEGNPHAVIYAFGEYYNDNATGIHNIHMNQGNTKYNPEENDIYHDGCFLIHLQDENKWIAYFLAFQSQSWCTDNHGKPLQGSVDSAGDPIGQCKYDTVDLHNT